MCLRTERLEAGGNVGGGCHARIVSETSTDLDSRIEAIASAVAALGWRLPREGRAPDALVWEFDLRRSYAATAVE